MGFLRRIFGGKKPASQSGASHKSGSETVKSKRRGSNIKHSKEKSPSATSDLNHIDLSTSSLPYSDSLNANKHAIAVAAATAAVAEAALATAHAAAEVVRLTNGGGGGGGLGPSTSQHRWPEEIAAVKIQSAFRGYLAKRALRALKALVKLQALVRGHIVRKQTADMLRRMQTLVRLQSRARAGRVPQILHSTMSPLSHHPVPEHYETSLRSPGTKFEGAPLLKRCSSNANYRDIGSGRSRVVSQWYDQWMEENVWNLPRGEDDEKSDKILEVDTWKPHLNSHQNENRLAYESPSKRSTKSLNHNLFFSSLKFQKRKQEKASTNSRELSSAHSYQNSPSESFSASRRRSGAFTPTRSECGYFGHPNYMANTESSRAKARSVSARRHRLWDSAGNHSDTHNSDFRTQCFTSSSRFNRVLSTHL